MSRAAEILSRVTISEIYTALTGIEPQRGRIPAPWRETRDRNVSLNDAKGTWFDHVEALGGGTLDFVSRVRGCDRQAALKWLAAMSGVPLSDEPLSPENRARWAEERRQMERHLPDAQHWRRAAVNMAEELLDSLKAALLDPMLPQPKIDEIGHVENMMRLLQRVDGAGLVTEYCWWLGRYPGLTDALVRAAKQREQVQRRALLAYLEQADTRKAAA